MPRGVVGAERMANVLARSGALSIAPAWGVWAATTTSIRKSGACKLARQRPQPDTSAGTSAVGDRSDSFVRFLKSNSRSASPGHCQETAQSSHSVLAGFGQRWRVHRAGRHGASLLQLAGCIRPARGSPANGDMGVVVALRVRISGRLDVGRMSLDAGEADGLGMRPLPAAVAPVELHGLYDILLPLRWRTRFCVRHGTHLEIGNGSSCHRDGCPYEGRPGVTSSTAGGTVDSVRRGLRR